MYVCVTCFVAYNIFLLHLCCRGSQVNDGTFYSCHGRYVRMCAIAVCWMDGISFTIMQASLFDLTETLLLIAAYYGQAHILALLIKKGFKVNDADATGATPLIHAAVSGQVS